MSDYQNRGLLFKNSRKWRPKHPDLTGEAVIDGRKFKMAAWTKQGRKGEFYSVAFTEEHASEPAPAAEAPQAKAESDDTQNSDNPQEDYAF